MPNSRTEAFEVTTISRRSALRFGLISIAIVIGLELFNGVVCYHHGVEGQLIGLSLVAIGFLPGLGVLFSKNPLRTVGAAMLFAPWLLFAFYTDCVRPYQGGGASMIYVAVVMYGFPCAAVGALLTGPVLKFLRITVK